MSDEAPKFAGVADTGALDMTLKYSKFFAGWVSRIGGNSHTSPAPPTPIVYPRQPVLDALKAKGATVG
jgi:hypothetical protein